MKATFWENNIWLLITSDLFNRENPEVSGNLSGTYDYSQTSNYEKKPLHKLTVTSKPSVPPASNMVKNRIWLRYASNLLY